MASEVSKHRCDQQAMGGRAVGRPLPQDSNWNLESRPGRLPGRVPCGRGAEGAEPSPLPAHRGLIPRGQEGVSRRVASSFHFLTSFK